MNRRPRLAALLWISFVRVMFTLFPAQLLEDSEEWYIDYTYKRCISLIHTRQRQRKGLKQKKKLAEQNGEEFALTWATAFKLTSKFSVSSILRILTTSVMLAELVKLFSSYFCLSVNLFFKETPNSIGLTVCLPSITLPDWKESMSHPSHYVELAKRSQFALLRSKHKKNERYALKK